MVIKLGTWCYVLFWLRHTQLFFKVQLVPHIQIQRKFSSAISEGELSPIPWLCNESGGHCMCMIVSRNNGTSTIITHRKFSQQIYNFLLSICSRLAESESVWLSWDLLMSQVTCCWGCWRLLAGSTVGLEQPPSSVGEILGVLSSVMLEGHTPGDILKD